MVMSVTAVMGYIELLHEDHVQRWFLTKISQILEKCSKPVYANILWLGKWSKNVNEPDCSATKSPSFFINQWNSSVLADLHCLCRSVCLSDENIEQSSCLLAQTKWVGNKEKASKQRTASPSQIFHHLFPFSLPPMGLLSMKYENTRYLIKVKLAFCELVLLVKVNCDFHNDSKNLFFLFQCTLRTEIKPGRELLTSAGSCVIS